MKWNGLIQAWPHSMRRMVFVLMVTAVPTARAQTIWTGPNTNFSQTTHNSSDADVILPGKVALSRNSAQWLFNTAADETSASSSSPSDTMWAFGTIGDYSTLNYVSFSSLRDTDLAGVILNKQMVLHLVNEDIYLSIKFTAWGQHGAGGFSYTRSTAPAAPPTPTVSITSPASGATFSAPASVLITASASVSSGTVPNVAFFAGTSLLGSNQTAPFNFTAVDLATGNYSLTAVATAAGISATSLLVSFLRSPYPTLCQPFPGATSHLLTRSIRDSRTLSKVHRTWSIGRRSLPMSPQTAPPFLRTALV
jgi:hypothetical protein